MNIDGQELTDAMRQAQQEASERGQNPTDPTKQPAGTGGVHVPPGEGEGGNNPEGSEQQEQSLGGGIVIQKQDPPANPNHPTTERLNPHLASNITQYMQEMDETINTERAAAERLGYNEAVHGPGAAAQGQGQQQAEGGAQQAGGGAASPSDAGDDDDRYSHYSDADSADAEQENDPDYDPEFKDKYEGAVVYIDKIGMGKVEFTEEERSKLERAKTIRLEEVEVVKVNTLKVRKAKKDGVDKVIANKASISLTPIALTGSGYTAVIKGCSPYEVASLMSGGESPVLEMRTKWSTIFSAIENTSIGKMEFDEFLKATAALDYNTYIFGMLCATYPEESEIPLDCPKCKATIDHKYSPRSLIRAEKMSDRLKELFQTVVDASHNVESAKAIHHDSYVKSVVAVTLPISGYIFEIHLQSAYDLIYNTIKGISQNKDPKYNQAGLMSTNINRVLVEADDEPGAYDQYTSAMDITKLIYSLTDRDLLILAKQIEKTTTDLTFEFGLMDVKCNNPDCTYHRQTMPVEIDTLLFYQYRQAMSTKVE